MWEIIVGCLICFFAAVGMLVIFKALIFRFFKGSKGKAYIIIDPDTNREDLEYTLMSWEIKSSWIKEKSLENIIILDKDLSEEDKKLCRVYTQDKEIFKIMTPEEFYKNISYIK